MKTISNIINAIVLAAVMMIRATVRLKKPRLT